MLDNTCVITFAGTGIHRQYQKEFHGLYSGLFKRCIEYTKESVIDTEFYANNQQMFQYEKYFGYFLWKPFLIQRTLDMVSEPYVLYCDSNLRFTNIKEFERSFREQMETQGTYLVRHENFINKHWTKRDTFILMRCDEERYWNAHQVWTPLVGFSKSEESRLLLHDYLATCRNPEIVTEMPNIYGVNLDGFREHRWEQSVLSILVEKYGLSGVPDTQVMNWVTKLYSEELLKYKEKVNADPLAKSV